MKKLNLKIERGTTVALVGPSGSGKSTTLQMLLRFYDPDVGNVFVSGKRTVDYESLHVLRRNFGLVSQEPVLFDRTVAENIAYGDNTRVVPMPEIIVAARNANIHEFISNLPEVLLCLPRTICLLVSPSPSIVQRQPLIECIPSPTHTRVTTQRWARAAGICRGDRSSG